MKMCQCHHDIVGFSILIHAGDDGPEMKRLLELAKRENPNLVKINCGLHSSNNADKKSSQTEMPELLPFVQKYTAGVRHYETRINDAFKRLLNERKKVSKCFE